LVRIPSKCSNLLKKGAVLIKGSIKDLSDEIFNDYEIDVLFHLAWDSVNNVNSINHLQTHYREQKTFLKKTLNSRIKKIIITGSCFEYGMQNGLMNVMSKTKPVTKYGIAKDNLRKWTQKKSNTYSDKTFFWTRIFYVYGEGQNSKSLYPSLIKAIKNKENSFNLSRGFQIRDFIHIDDVIKKLISLIVIDKKGFFIQNICSENPKSVREFVEMILKKNNYNLKLNLGYYDMPVHEPVAFWGQQN
jgi:dTDP-6-deoxy-L-talose 4-dehydrogenase (NAD+)